MAVLAVGETERDVRRSLDSLREAGFSEERLASFVPATPEQILERAHAYREAGIEGLTIRMANPHDPDAVTLLGETLAPLFSPRAVR
jgi:alkanesulfonate monooxygenase SsuD/methylene tetrahydromethanopterin reductase-like flavin-dependent oxidoreductase (luciferase family)